MSDHPGLFPTDLFLSHNQEEDITRIAMKLTGLRVRVDYDSDWTETATSTLDHAIAERIANARFIVSCEGSRYRPSAWCEFELEHATGFERAFRITRLLTLRTDSHEGSPTTPTEFLNTSKGLAELAAFVAFHNHPSISASEYERIRDRIPSEKAEEEIFPLSCDRVDELSRVSTEVLRSVLERARRFSPNHWKDWFALSGVRNSLLWIDPTSVIRVDYEEVLDLIMANVPFEYLSSRDSDSRAEALYLAAILGVSRRESCVVAFNLAAREMTPSILRDANHFARIVAGECSHGNSLLDFISRRATALENTFRTRANVWVRESTFEPLEKSLLFARMLSALLEQPSEWNPFRMEAVSIQLFQCLFDRPRPVLAKPVNLGAHQQEIMSILILALEQLVVVSQSAEARPVRLLEGLYPDFVLPALALGINSGPGLSSRFRAVADYIHDEFVGAGIGRSLVRVYEWYLREASREFPTTHFREFHSRYLGAINNRKPVGDA